MRETERLIDALVAEATPVRRLAGPGTRWCIWAGVAAVAAAIAFALHGIRDDLADCLTEADFLTGTASPLLTGLLAAAGALLASMPDRSARWLLLPLPSAIVWIGGTTGGCLLNWVTTDFSYVTLDDVVGCLGVLAMVALPLSVTQYLMLRPLARIAPRGTIAVGCLATAAISASVLNLAHAFETSALLLIWSLGSGALVFTLDWLAARGLFRWMRPASSIYAAR